MMSKNRLNTIIIIVLAAILSLGATITGIVVSRREFSKLTEKSGCITDSMIEALKDVLDNVCAYKNLLNVKYDVNATCNQKLSKLQTSKQPHVTFTGSLRQDCRYTLLMVDPDAPGSSVAQLIFYLHWVVTGMSAENLKTGNFPEVLKEYMGPSPPRKQLHRYQFIVFEEAKGIDVTLTSPNRGGFKMEEFIKENELCDFVGLFQFKLEDV